MQLSLFDHVKSSFAESDRPLSNEELYKRVARSAGLSEAQLNTVQPVGNSQLPCKVVKREIRWHQQTLKKAGLLQRSSLRGEWELTESGKTKLRRIKPHKTLLAFSTKLGAAVWSLNGDFLADLDTPITLCLTSPPYPLKRPRAYGNPSLEEYTEFVVESIRPVAENLADGGSICINISNDVFQPGTPARSTYREQLVISLCRELGLWKMDELVWENACKPPGPAQWASKTRQQLNTTYEPIYWFTNNPQACKADNRRVLQQHTDRHQQFMASGGARKRTEHSDGAYTTRPGSYGNVTSGKIPRNILKYPHNCASQRRYKSLSRGLGLPVHGAPFPLAMTMFLIQFLSEPGDLVVDRFGGSVTTGVGSEISGRRWLVIECMWEYLRGGGERFIELAEADLTWSDDFLSVA